MKSTSCAGFSTTPSKVPLGSHAWFTFQHTLLLIAIILTVLTLLLTIWLAVKHLRHYVVPNEQRQIVRLIWTPFIFAILSVISIARYSAEPYMVPLADLYEAYGFTALFMLLVSYVSPSLDRVSRDQFFSTHQLRKRNGTVASTPGGAYKWFNRIWVCVFQFLFVCAIFVLVTEISTARGKNCGDFHPRHAHFWIVIVPKVSTVIALVAVLRFYRGLKTELTLRRPLAKLLSFKLIVFFNFVQGIIFSILQSTDKLSGSEKFSTADLTLGLPAFLLVVETFFLIIFMHHAYRVSEYTSRDADGSDDAHAGQKEKMGFAAAAIDTLNLDMLRGLIHMLRLIFTGEIFRAAPKGAVQGKVQDLSG